MATFFVFVLAAVLFSVQSAPVDVDSTASASSAMHLLVKDSEDITDYHLTPFMKEIEDVNEEITAELDIMMPYINFFLDALFNGQKQEQQVESGCADDMVIQLVPEKSISSPEDDSYAAPSTLDVDDDSSDDDSAVPEAIAA